MLTFIFVYAVSIMIIMIIIQRYNCSFSVSQTSCWLDNDVSIQSKLCEYFILIVYFNILSICLSKLFSFVILLCKRRLTCKTRVWLLRINTQNDSTSLCLLYIVKVEGFYKALLAVVVILYAVLYRLIVANLKTCSFNKSCNRLSFCIKWKCLKVQEDIVALMVRYMQQLTVFK